MVSHWDEWKKKNAKRQETGVVRPWDVINPETQYMEPEDAKARLDICNNCEFLNALHQCQKCGCVMPVKVTLKHASCPIGKW